MRGCKVASGCCRTNAHHPRWSGAVRAPSSNGRLPIIARKRLVFPEPDLPTIPTFSPAWRSHEQSWKRPSHVASCKETKGDRESSDGWLGGGETIGMWLLSLRFPCRRRHRHQCVDVVLLEERSQRRHASPSRLLGDRRHKTRTGYPLLLMK